MNWSARRLGRRGYRRLTRLSDTTFTVAAVVVSILGTVWSFLDYQDVRIPSVAVIVLVFSSLVLGGRAMIGVVAVLTVCSVIVVVTHRNALEVQFSLTGVAMLAVVAVVAMIQAVRRDSIGLRRVSAETVLSRVGDQVDTQGTLPELPSGWHITVARHIPYGASIAGDFVSARVQDAGGGPVLDVALVDVSGHGVEAGSRALLLSGAVGGLLGSVPSEQFLPAVNEYARRHAAEPSLATATYLRVNLRTGAYELRSAGHPPPIVWSRAPAETRLSTSSGIVLGAVDELDSVPDFGVLCGGDALVLYSDGVVEERSVDVDTGIARLRARVGELLQSSMAGRLAEDILENAPHTGDDQTVVVLWNGIAAAGSAALDGIDGIDGLDGLDGKMEL